MSDSYVCSTAKIKCSCGDKISTLTVYPDRTVFLTGQPQANISDYKSMYNIAPFGKCHTVCYPATGSATAANHGKLTPMPCVPGTVTEWLRGKEDVLIKGKPALLKSSYCQCQFGGVITITFDGQTDTGQADLSKENVETEEQWDRKQRITPDEILDGIQLALDAAGFVPGLGAVPDLLNAAISAMCGDWYSAGLSVIAAVPGIGDTAKAVVMAQKGLKSARAVSKVSKIAKEADKSKRCAKLFKESSNFIGTDITKEQLLKRGVSNSDADFFMKKVRFQRRSAASKVLSDSPNVDMFSKESYLNGMDFSSPIEIGVARKGTKLGMYVNKDIKGELGNPGNYAFEIKQGKPRPTTEQLGVSDMGARRIEYDNLGKIKQGSPKENYYYKKEYHEVEITQDTVYVKSKSRKIVDNWSDKQHPRKLSGGAEQIFLQDKGYVRVFK